MVIEVMVCLPQGRQGLHQRDLRLFEVLLHSTVHTRRNTSGRVHETEAVHVPYVADPVVCTVTRAAR